MLAPMSYLVKLSLPDILSVSDSRMNNGKVASIETDRLRKLEKTNG